MPLTSDAGFPSANHCTLGDTVCQFSVEVVRWSEYSSCSKSSRPSLHHFCSSTNHEVPSVVDTCHFSLVCDVQYGEIWVHWKDQDTHHMEGLFWFSFRDWTGVRRRSYPTYDSKHHRIRARTSAPFDSIEISQAGCLILTLSYGVSCC